MSETNEPAAEAGAGAAAVQSDVPAVVPGGDAVDANAAVENTGGPADTVAGAEDQPEATEEETEEQPQVTSEVSSAIVGAQKEFLETGALTEETYAALEKAGLPREVVDGYAAVYQEAAAARQAVETSALLNEVLGENGVSEWNQINQWAAESLPEAEVETYNKGFETGGEQAKALLRGLKARYEQHAAATGDLMGSAASPMNFGAQPFKSKAEQDAAFQDRRYFLKSAAGIAYREVVDQRLTATKRRGGFKS